MPDINDSAFADLISARSSPSFRRNERRCSSGPFCGDETFSSHPTTTRALSAAPSLSPSVRSVAKSDSFVFYDLRTLSHSAIRVARIFNNLRTLCIVNKQLSLTPSFTSALFCKNIGGIYPWPALSIDFREPLATHLARPSTVLSRRVQIAARTCNTVPKRRFSVQIRCLPMPVLRVATFTCPVASFLPKLPLLSGGAIISFCTHALALSFGEGSSLFMGDNYGTA